jgi:hypothetical protein
MTRKISWTLFSAALAAVVLAQPALAQGTMFVEDDKVGIHTATPQQEFHLNDGPDSNPNGAFRISTASHAWDFATINNNGTFRISKLGTGTSEFDLSAAGNLTITGRIFTSGSCGSGCDRVFSPDFELESIEEHAASMWTNSHLPAVGPTPEEGPFDLSNKTLGMLNELEKAHIYIEQLNEALEEKDHEVADLRARLERLERLVTADGE